MHWDRRRESRPTPKGTGSKEGCNIPHRNAECKTQLIALLAGIAVASLIPGLSQSVRKLAGLAPVPIPAESLTAPMQANILPPTFQASWPPPQGSDTSAPGKVRPDGIYDLAAHRAIPRLGRSTYFAVARAR